MKKKMTCYQPTSRQLGTQHSEEEVEAQQPTRPKMVSDGQGVTTAPATHRAVIIEAGDLCACTG
jgi:hypothetical protein